MRDGGHRVDARPYAIEIDAHEPTARVWPADGGTPTSLMLLADLDSDQGRDATLAVRRLTVKEDEGGVAYEFTLVSTTWQSKTITVRCAADEIAVSVSVSGRGSLGEVRLLAGWYSGNRRRGAGMFYSQWPVQTLFVPSPNDPRRTVQPAAEPATIGVVGGDTPGRGHWFFTPGPFLFAGSRAAVSTPDDASAAPWQTIELRAGVEQMGFTEWRYQPSNGGFSLRLDYEGYTDVDDEFTSPEIVLRFGAADPYEAVTGHAERLRAAGIAPRPVRAPADWWSRPIFCGWGEQVREARRDGGSGPDYSRQDNYDRWLAVLQDRGVVPGTIVIDDRWQASYGINEVAVQRWPDLRQWIRRRHDGGQHVLLWFKAWDAEGLPADACVTDSSGARISADPDSPAYRAILRTALEQMLSSDGFNADGLKVDFTAQTPAGPGLVGASRAWGVALLHRLLRLVYDYAKEIKPDALVVTQTPNPLFADVTDMIRLNDLLRLSEPDPWAPAVEQMTHRARIALAVDAGWLIDTDDWCMPNKHEWRAYLEVKRDLGVPALYYATGIDLSGEDFDEDDYAAIRRAWAI